MIARLEDAPALQTNIQPSRSLRPGSLWNLGISTEHCHRCYDCVLPSSDSTDPSCSPITGNNPVSDTVDMQGTVVRQTGKASPSRSWQDIRNDWCVNEQGAPGVDDKEELCPGFASGSSSPVHPFVYCRVRGKQTLDREGTCAAATGVGRSEEWLLS